MSSGEPSHDPFVKPDWDLRLRIKLEILTNTALICPQNCDIEKYLRNLTVFTPNSWQLFIPTIHFCINCYNIWKINWITLLNIHMQICRYCRFSERPYSLTMENDHGVFESLLKEPEIHITDSFVLKSPS